MTAETKNMIRFVVALVCAIGVGGYFLYAAYPKIVEPRQFAIDIKNYQMLPQQYLNLVALYLPWLETVAAIAMIVPKTRRPGSIIIAGLLLFFIGAVSYAAFYKGLDITCGCTGKDSAKAGWPTIQRNTFLLILTSIAVFLPRKTTVPSVGFDVVFPNTPNQPAVERTPGCPCGATSSCSPDASREASAKFSHGAAPEFSRGTTTK